MTTMTTEEIMKMLPHRYPMLMVDRIVECDDKARIVGIKNVTATEPFLAGHFPNKPIMPGVLQLEAMAQTAGVLLNRLTDLSGKVPYFLTVDQARFRRVVRPGDQMRIEIEFIKYRGSMGKFRGVVKVDGQVASEAEMMCMVTEETTGL